MLGNTEAQIAALEKAKEEKIAQGEIEIEPRWHIIRVIWALTIDRIANPL